MKIFEIFNSVNGEVGLFPQGSLITFLRMAGCNLKCTWCDTARTQDPNTGLDYTAEIAAMNVDNSMKNGGVDRLLITGGEPLYRDQDELAHFLSALRGRRSDQGKDTEISVETNGTIVPDAFVFDNVDGWVVDLKPEQDWPEASELPDQFSPFKTWLKFPIRKEEDIWRAVTHIQALEKRGAEYQYAFCPLKGVSDYTPAEMVAKIWKYKRIIPMDRIRINCQIHKALGVA